MAMKKDHCSPIIFARLAVGQNGIAACGRSFQGWLNNEPEKRSTFYYILPR